MGKVINHFLNGCPGAVTRSVDDIVISIRNASGGDISSRSLMMKKILKQK